MKKLRFLITIYWGDGIKCSSWWYNQRELGVRRFHQARGITTPVRPWTFFKTLSAKCDMFTFPLFQLKFVVHQLFMNIFWLGLTVHDVRTGWMGVEMLMHSFHHPAAYTVYPDLALFNGSFMCLPGHGKSRGRVILGWSTPRVWLCCCILIE